MTTSTRTPPARVPGAHRRQRLSRLDTAGRFCARNARVVGVVWIVAVVLAFALAAGAFGTGSLFERLTSGAPNVPGDAREAQDLIGAAEGTGGTTTLLLDRVDPASAATRTAVEAAAQRLRSNANVLQVGTPYDGRAGQVLMASDRQALLVTATLKPDLGGQSADEARLVVENDLLAIAGKLPGSTARVTSVDRLVDAITGQIEVDLRTGEGIALPISLLVMALVFGGFIAAGMPIAGAIASIAGALASLFLFSTFLDLDATVVNVVSVLGLGLCIDYGLLMVSRFREEVRRDLIEGSAPDREQVIAAVGRTVATAGRTVLFSGITVTISVGGMLVFQAQILRAIGAASISVVVVAMLVAIFGTPVMLAMFGQRLVRPGSLYRVPGLRRLLRQFGDIAPAHGMFSRLAALVQRRPLIWVIAVVLVLLTLCLPLSSLRLTASGVGLLPADQPVRQVLEEIDTRFPLAQAPDVQVVLPGATSAQAAAYARAAGQFDQVTGVDPVRALPAAAGRPPFQLVSLRAGGDPLSDRSRALVRQLRDHPPDGRHGLVAGPAALLADFTDAMLGRAPIALALVVLATGVLLFAMTGSLLIPVKALLMNALSLGASLGILSWIFTGGHLTGLLGYTPANGIESTVPVLMLAFGFGLSMDYEVFLLARILERHRAGEATDAAVRHGLQATGRIITCAAALVVIVFSGFVFGKLLVVKETGVALAVAVIIDATLVRMLLVPATMTLLGRANWWAPGPLVRLQARIGLRH
jgi:putative drug exporter of the RND superfamily